jgi:hypothetical protein
LDVHLDVEAVERAERDLNAFINRRSRDREKANTEAALQKAADRRRHEAYREECRALWVAHLRRLAGSYLAMARDARRRARELETNVKER